jgi:hypothetical protein
MKEEDDGRRFDDRLWSKSRQGIESQSGSHFLERSLVEKASSVGRNERM